jgi:DNA-binding NarL/FixJ family response regulator
MTDEARPASLFGPLRSVLVPEPLWCSDPQEFVRALLAWRFDLTRQEIRVLEYLTLGLSDAEIAAQMRVAGLNSVKKIVRTVLSKLRVHNRTQAAVLAARCGLGVISNQMAHPNG